MGFHKFLAKFIASFLSRVARMPRMTDRVLSVLLLALLVGSLSPLLSQEAAGPMTTDDNSAAPAEGEAPKAPKIQSPLSVEPESPEEVFDALLLMIELDRLDVAKLYLDQFMSGNPDDALLLKLREQYGVATFLKLSNLEELHPESRTLLEQNNAAFTKASQDPARIAGLIKDLTSAEGEKREIALHFIETEGAEMVAPLIKTISTTVDGDDEAALVYAITRIGRPAIPPLMGALESPSLQVKAATLRAIGAIRSKDALPYLWYFAAAEGENTPLKPVATQTIRHILRMETQAGELTGITDILRRQALEHYREEYPWKTGADGKVELWSWSNEHGTVARSFHTPSEASTLVGLMFAHQALTLAPHRTDVQVAYLNLLLTRDVGQVGWFDPLPIGQGTAYDLSLTTGPGLLTKALLESLKHRRTGPAVIALRVLSQLGTNRQLRSQGEAGVASIVSALNYPDLRVQYAAAATLITLDQKKTFSGAPRVVSILGQSLLQMETNRHRALVIDSDKERGQNITGFLGTLSYEATFAPTGRDGFKMAAETHQFDLILVHANVSRWGLSDTLANVRADARTSGIPVVIYGGEDLTTKMQVYTGQFRDMLFVVEPNSSDDLREQMTTFLESRKTTPLTPEERRGFAQQSAQLLNHLSQTRSEKIYDLTTIEPILIQMVRDGALAADLIPVVASLGTQLSQKTLADIALDDAATSVNRATAATQLAWHIQRHSLLLEDAAIQALHAAQHSNVEPELHTAYSAVLGSLQPDDKLVGERLSAFGGGTKPQTPAPDAVQQ